MGHPVIEWDEGWDCIHKGITKVQRIVQGSSEPQFSSEEYMKIYTTIYNMSTQNPPRNYAEQLYVKYRETIGEYITSVVLPSLKGKHEEFMLQELVKCWETYKALMRWLLHFFRFLDDYCNGQKDGLHPALKEVATQLFQNLVCRQVNAKVRFAVLGLIDKDRDGEQIDKALVKNVINILVEVGMGGLDVYEKDFEQYMLCATRDYYSRKASRWIVEAAYGDYLLKAEECLKMERDRVSHYLLPDSEKKLVEIVQHALVVDYVNQLIAKKHSESGSSALLTVDYVEELSRKFIANLDLEQQAEDVAMSQADETW